MEERQVPKMEELYAFYQNAVLLTARRYLGNCADADDAAQETFTTAQRRYSEINPTMNIKAWLCTICRNNCMNIKREIFGRKNTLPVGQVLGTDGPAFDPVDKKTLEPLEEAENNEIIEITNTAVLELPTEQREVLKLRTEGKSTKEISELLGISLSRVGYALTTARDTLRKKLGDIALDKRGYKKKEGGDNAAPSIGLVLVPLSWFFLKMSNWLL